MSQASWPLCRGELFLRGFLQWVVSEVRPESLHLVRWFWFLHIEQTPSLAASSDLYVMGPCPSAGLKPSSWMLYDTSVTGDTSMTKILYLSSQNGL